MEALASPGDAAPPARHRPRRRRAGRGGEPAGGRVRAHPQRRREPRQLRGRSQLGPGSHAPHQDERDAASPPAEAGRRHWRVRGEHQRAPRRGDVLRDGGVRGPVEHRRQPPPQRLAARGPGRAVARGPARLPARRRGARLGGARAGGGRRAPRALRGRPDLPSTLPAAPGAHRHPRGAAGAERGRAPRHLPARGAPPPLRHRRPGQGAFRAPAAAAVERLEREPARAGGRGRDGKGGRPPRGGVAVAAGILRLPARLPSADPLRVRDGVRSGSGGAGRDLPRSAGHAAHRTVLSRSVGGAGRPCPEDLHAPVRGRRCLRQRAGGPGAGAVGGVLPPRHPQTAHGPVRGPGHPPPPGREPAREGGPESPGHRGHRHLPRRPRDHRTEPGAVPCCAGRPVEPHPPGASSSRARDR